MTSPTESVPYGFCHCGCGGKTTVADRNKTATRMVKGQPMRFVVGHRVKPKSIDLDAKPFKIDGVYCRLIPLTRGLHAIVDAADYEWLMQRCSWQAARAGKKGRPGFYAVNRDGEFMHRLICTEGEQADHENRIGLDNRRRNLRPCLQGDNKKNASKRRDNTSGYKGVYRVYKNNYAASIQCDGKALYLGYFRSPETAARAYDEAARRLHGEFASTNF